MDGRSPKVPKGRLEAYSDGVFAIVVTLLVLELHVPVLQGDHLSVQLFRKLLAEAPYAVSYALSFLLVTVYWVNHHQLFVALSHADRDFLWLNSLFLMCVTVIPFPTAILGRYPAEPVAAVFYGLSNLLVAGSFMALRYYASFAGRLMHPGISGATRRQALRRGLVSPCLYLSGIGLAWVSPWIAWGCYLAVPVYFFLPAAFETQGVTDKRESDEETLDIKTGVTPGKEL